MVLLTPFSQGTHLRSVGRLIVVSDQAYHRCVVSEFDNDIAAVCGCELLYKIQRRLTSYSYSYLHVSFMSGPMQ